MMKQQALFLLIFSLIFNTLQSQSQSKWTWGIQAEIGLSGEKGGSLHSGISGNTERIFGELSSRKPAIGGGLWINYQLLRRLGLRSGIQYMNAGDQKSSRFSSGLPSAKKPDTYTSSRFTTRVQRIQIPVIVEFQFLKIKFNPTIGAGVLLSKDFVSSIDEQIVNINNTPAETNNHWRFSKSTSMKRIQFKANIGLKINAHLHLEFNHVVGPSSSVVTWAEDSEDGQFSPYRHFYCATGLDPTLVSTVPTKTATTQYHQLSSIVFRYAL